MYINETVNKFLLAGDKSMPEMHLRQSEFLLAGDKFMPEIHLRQPGSRYSACGPFTKNKERIQKFKETRNSQYIYQNELDKVCLQHDMAYRGFKDLTRGTASNKILSDKAFNVAKNAKYDGYQRGLNSVALFACKFLIKKLLVVPLHFHGQRS